MKTLRLVYESAKETILKVVAAIVYTLEINLYNFVTLLQFACPYIMMYVTYNLYCKRGVFVIGSEIMLPIIIFFISSVTKTVLNKRGKGNEIPVPEKRFTTDKYDIVEVEDASRLEELILYVYEVEEYLRRTGKTKE